MVGVVDDKSAHVALGGVDTHYVDGIVGGADRRNHKLAVRAVGIHLDRAVGKADVAAEAVTVLLALARADRGIGKVLICLNSGGDRALFGHGSNLGVGRTEPKLIVAGAARVGVSRADEDSVKGHAGGIRNSLTDAVGGVYMEGKGVDRYEDKTAPVNVESRGGCKELAARGLACQTRSKSAGDELAHGRGYIKFGKSNS